MIPARSIAGALGVSLALLLAGCGDNHDGEGSGEHSSSAEDSDSVISDGEEESGIEYGRNDTYDETRRGARLILAYDANTDAFIGTVENTTSQTLEEVRVEVHLSNGVELGPTTPGNIAAGSTADIVLDADGEDFERWSAHPEVGRDEHSNEGEGEGEEHDEGGESGEHDGDGD